ncbi:MAG: glycosyltransferase [Chlorobiaceae bacterium]|nr:glycosyltransferase [Chlorobiaceae bacterium]
MHKPTLTIIPSVPVWKEGSTLRFDRKFYDGVLLYCRFWPGPVVCVMQQTRSALPDFGVVEKHAADMPFTCIALAENEPVAAEHIENSGIVLASADAHDQLHIARLCRNRGVRCVYVIEYIPETRYQIAALNAPNRLVRMRQNFYLWRKEAERRQAFGECDGLQSNGTPAYHEYRNAPNRLLYFDTRVPKEEMIDLETLENRLSTLGEKRPLRLAFSGRLVQMKGADHLVRLALKLKTLGMAFRMTIYGAGDLEGEMKEFIARHKLEGKVIMPGAVDFHRQLLPDMKEKVDLFVCLHRQSDPSCTYLETLSCGVPIVGYLNRAFGGILELEDAGWGAPLDDLEAVASIIRRLDANRAEIAEKSHTAARFASRHDVETTFRNRVEHLLSIIRA